MYPTSLVTKNMHQVTLVPPSVLVVIRVTSPLGRLLEMFENSCLLVTPKGPDNMLTR